MITKSILERIRLETASHIVLPERTRVEKIPHNFKLKLGSSLKTPSDIYRVKNVAMCVARENKCVIFFNIQVQKKRKLLFFSMKPFC